MAYVKTTDFSAKDALASGNPAKIVKGTEIDDEFNAIETADSLNLKTTALGTGVETFLGTPSATNLQSAVTGDDVAFLGTAQAFTAQQTFKEVKDTVHTITDGAAFEIDPANGAVQTVVLGANRTPAATNLEAGQAVLLGIDDGTAYSVTWSTISPTWVRSGGSGAAPTLAASGFTWVLLWKVGSTVYASDVGQP